MRSCAFEAASTAAPTAPSRVRGHPSGIPLTSRVGAATADVVPAGSGLLWCEVATPTRKATAATRAPITTARPRGGQGVPSDSSAPRWGAKMRATLAGQGGAEGERHAYQQWQGGDARCGEADPGYVLHP